MVHGQEVSCDRIGLIFPKRNDFAFPFQVPDLPSPLSPPLHSTPYPQVAAVNWLPWPSQQGYATTDLYPRQRRIDERPPASFMHLHPLPVLTHPPPTPIRTQRFTIACSLEARTASS